MITIGFAQTSYTVSESVGTFQVGVEVFNPTDDQPLPGTQYIALVIQTIPGTASKCTDNCIYNSILSLSMSQNNMMIYTVYSWRK